jgi:MFS family permease
VQHQEQTAMNRSIESPGILAYETKRPSRVWSVGTLSYTTAGLAILFFWLLLGDFALQMKERSVDGMFRQLLRKFEASSTLVGVLTSSMPQLIFVLLAPVISFWSDRHRGRRGRRIPFLLVPAPIAALAMVAVAYSPQLGVALHEHVLGPAMSLNSSVLLLLGCSWILFELASLTGTFLLGSLVNDVVPVRVIGLFYGLFRAVSLGCGIIFNYWLLGRADEWYFWIFISLGLIYVLGFTAMCLRVREGEYPPVEPLKRSQLLPPGFFRSIAGCFTHRIYLLTFIGTTLMATSLLSFNLFSQFYAQDIGVSLDLFGKLTALSYTASFALAVPIGWLADRLHPVRLCFFTIMTYALTMGAGFLAVHDAKGFCIAYVAHTVISGCYFTASASVGPRLFPRAKFAQFMSTLGIFTALGVVWVGPTLGQFLDLTGKRYEFTFAFAFALALASLGIWRWMWNTLNRLGGVRGYQAPGEPTDNVTHVA